ncbi:Asp-tRNA(Asn)/Glu-tRNA(Gln) amidotransferase subunit GatC [Candidatus Peregrinibacteria bacterium]|nr:Asp-tRNA(Asn)/Glu-tRNA(Gln) amidotransferase subunit GatC [Candidatus Peregrinibacteria bacterium]
MIDESTVRHVSKLARIDLTDGEVRKFSGQLEKVFGYMEILNEVDVLGAAETSQVTGLKNVTEKDEIVRGQAGRGELLKCTELPVDSNQIRVSRAVK